MNNEFIATPDLHREPLPKLKGTVYMYNKQSTMKIAPGMGEPNDTS